MEALDDKNLHICLSCAIAIAVIMDIELKKVSTQINHCIAYITYIEVNNVWVELSVWTVQLI